MSTLPVDDRPLWGFAAFIVGALALVAVSLQIGGMFAEPEPQQSTAQAIGEFAAEIRDSAQRALSGEPAPAPPPPVETGPSLQDMLIYIIPGFAALAVILGGISLFKREPWHLPAIGIGLGLGAVVMQYAILMAMMIIGGIILAAILNNIGDILGG